MTVRATTPLLVITCALAAACSTGPAGDGLTPATHAYFPVATGDHAFDCAACHTDPATFRVVSCVDCHTHTPGVTDLLHGGVAGYAFATEGCVRCHPAPVRQGFSHTGITGNCAVCHDTGAAFAALPRPGFTHIATRGEDCGSCHDTRTWDHAGAPGVLVHDTARDVTVTGLVPSWSGTTISGLTARAQTFHMEMDHAAAALPAATLADCAICHASLSTGTAFPGVLHASLAAKGLPQPATCGDCHGLAAPAGFVGPTASAPARTPASGEMRHDAVAWTAGAPTTTRLVTQDCAVCHATPTATAATWSSARTGAGPAAYHASLAAARLAQPATCTDCHANGRPRGVLTSAGAALPPRVTYDHALGGTGECATCHDPAAPAGTTAWTGGRFHLGGAAAPSSCLPCHAGERPTSAAGWASTTYRSSPFDYGTNASGITHGDGLDCVTCHAGPGTGAWGVNQNWLNGSFAHGPASAARTTCIACHMSQRPDLQPGLDPAALAVTLGFDHARDGKGDCFGCHQATVAAGRYVDFFAPSTGALPGGDWRGGKFYPGATIVSDPGSAVTVDELLLTRTGTWITGFTTTRLTLYGGMSHTSSAIPAELAPGPADSPDTGKCWHCHTNVNGEVTSYAGGTFHPALDAYTATPGGTVQRLPQPTAGCADCHAPMWPGGIVLGAGSSLRPMDHSATFAAPASIGGVTAAAVDDLDCSRCHARPGDTFSDGTFHAKIGAAVPADCTFCHYPLMASAAADTASGTRYAMAHTAPAVTVQRCEACHGSALSKSTSAPAVALWQPGAYHPSLSSQPSTCLACHTGSAPPAATQSDVTYVLPAGGTGSNGAQWMSHAAAGVAGAECGACHASDAKASGAAWSKGTRYHAAGRTPARCADCHGLTNGNGAIAGTNNNLPAGLTDATTLTTASASPGTGIPAGTHDQLVHTDLNVTSHDCGFCHTQAGTSTVAGVSGKEWAQARFHGSFSAGAPLVTNGTTARCSHCHMNLKPGPAYVGQDHSTFTDVSGSRDCSSCHAWPGTGTASAPNWKGAGAPEFITVGGFTVPNPPSSPARIQAGVANLPHPSTTGTATCATCHTGGAGGKGAIGYDHASTLVATHCNACHEAGSDLVGARWNGATTIPGAGDTRPYTLASVTANYKGNTLTITGGNHFFLDRAGQQVECYRCHTAPAGVAVVTTGTAYRTAWAFAHPANPDAIPVLDYCYLCHPTGKPQ